MLTKIMRRLMGQPVDALMEISAERFLGALEVRAERDGWARHDRGEQSLLVFHRSHDSARFFGEELEFRYRRRRDCEGPTEPLPSRAHALRLIIGWKLGEPEVRVCPQK